MGHEGKRQKVARKRWKHEACFSVKQVGSAGIA